MIIPCYECLKYPICVNEFVVQCDSFHKYAYQIAPMYNDHDDPVHNLNTVRYWDHLQTIIPKLSKIYKETMPWNPI